MFFLALSFSLSLTIGFFLTCLLWPGRPDLRSCFLPKISLSVGMGFGISSCGFFVLVMVFGLPFAGFVLAEVLSALSLAGLFFYRNKVKNRIPQAVDTVPGSKSRAHPLLSIAFYATLATSISAYILMAMRMPHGGWDAWAAWNMRARFIFRAGDRWKDLFSGIVYNRAWDYPLLITGLVARCWKYIANDAVLVPVLILMFFMLATAGLLFSAVSLLRNKNQGCLAGIVLLGTPYFITHASSQYGDVPLGFFFLGGIVLLALRDRLFEKNCSLLFLAGMMAAFAAWTKNEGLIFLPILAATLFVTSVISRGWKRCFQEMFFFCLGALPALIIIIYYKTHIVSSFFTYFSSMDSQSTVARLADFSNYPFILGFFRRKFVDFGGVLVFGKTVIGFLPLLAVYVFLLGIKIRKENKIVLSASGIALFFMLAGYFVVYLLTPDTISIPQMIVNSIDRFFLQLWPSFLFFYFMAVRAPEETYPVSVKPSFQKKPGRQKQRF